MKKPKEPGNAPKGKLTIIKDFLPAPALLARKSVTVPVTARLTQSSIDYLKKEARKSKIPYQRLLRSVLDSYVAKHSGD